MKGIPIVGQKLFSLNVGNSARNREQVLTPVFVVSVGRKYFKVKKNVSDGDWCATEYHIEDWCEKTEYTASSKLYVVEQEWFDEKESQALALEIEKKFKYGTYEGVSLKSLREIVKIIKEGV